MKKILLVIAIMLFVLPNIFAQDYEGYLNQNVKIWVDVHGKPTIVSGNITITNQNNVTVVNNSALTKLNPDLYYYILYPNTTGYYWYHADLYSSGGNIVDHQYGVIYIEENEQMYLAILFGLVFLIIGAFYYGREMRSKPYTSVNTWIVDQLSTKDVAVMFDLIGALLFIPLVALLSIWSTGTQYAPIFDKIQITGTLLVGFGVLIYLVLYLIYRYNEQFETLADMTETKKGSGRRGR